LADRSAFFCTFYYLEKTYTQVEYNILTNDQIDRFETYLGQLREVLNKICVNLEKKQTEDFIGKKKKKFSLVFSTKIKMFFFV
jgi:hypothetical protein